MQAQLGAVRTAVHSVAAMPYLIRLRNLAGFAAVALTLAACIPATVPLAGQDPADPTARVAGAHYRSTVAPYTSLRPSAPLSWREQNDRAAPAPKSGRSE
jgi:hypothetical protein